VKIAHGVARGVAITNSIALHGDYGIIGSDRGVGNDSIAAYLPGASITHNVLAGGSSSAYPCGNSFPGIDEYRRQFVNFDAHDYHLAPQSAWHHAASDGRDLGADMAFTRPSASPVR
jgi:hypothetical protein